MNEAGAQAFPLAAPRQVAQRVPEGAEHERLVVITLRLVDEDFQEGVGLWIVVIKGLGLREDGFYVRPDLRDKACIGIAVAVTRFHELKLVELAAQHVLEQRGQPVETACRLTADRRHHEGDVLLPVHAPEDARDYGEQVVMEPALRRGELDAHGFGLAGRELPDIAAAGPVDQGAERVELLEAEDQADTLLVAQRVAAQPVVDALESGRLPNEQAAPLRFRNMIEARAGFGLPAGLRAPAVPDCFVDWPVGFSHLREAGVIDDEIGTQHVQQRVEVLAPQLHRRGRHQHYGLRVIAEIPYRLVLESLGVPDVVRLVDDDEIELRRRIESQQPLILAAAPGAAEDEIGIEQRVGKDRLRVLLRPLPLKGGLLQTVAQ